MNELRAVFDTGVVVSAVLMARSTPRKAFDRAASSGALLASAATVEELEEVLRRSKFAKYVAERARLEFLAAYANNAEIVPITETISECRDPNDNKFLELAVSGRASHIITGDQDLLILNPLRGISIVTPAAFLRTLDAGP